MPSIPNYNSKFPPLVRDKLAKELKKLVKGKIFNVKIDLKHSLKAKINVAWLEDDYASQIDIYNLNKDILDRLNQQIEKQLKEFTKSKILSEFDNKIKKFLNKLDKISLKYDTIASEELHLMTKDYNIENNNTY